MWEHLDELAALVLIVGCLALLGLGIDGEVKSILLMAGGWLFGSRYQRRRKREKAPSAPVIGDGEKVRKARERP